MITAQFIAPRGAECPLGYDLTSLQFISSDGSTSVQPTCSRFESTDYYRGFVFGAAYVLVMVLVAGKMMK